MSLPNGVYGHADSERSLEHKGQDVVIPIFYIEKSLNKKKSEAAGRAIFDEYEAAKFIIPGDNTYEHKERVTDALFSDENGERRVSWVKRYEAFKSGLEQTDGMPLDAWYKIINHPGLIEEMRAMKIRSVEDLARLSDDFAMRTSWGLEWRKTAKAEIDARKNKENMAEANAELTASLEAEKAARVAMERRLADMEAALAAKPKGKGGRPRKTVAVEVAA